MLGSLALGALLATVYPASALVLDPARPRYFDPHTHVTGVLPYQAYADLPAFIRSLADPAVTVTQADKLALFRYLSQTWYPQTGAALGNRAFAPAEGQRFSLGARATLVVYPSRIAADPALVDGALERILTATPYTEFDSAYAFRGAPAHAYLLAAQYSGDESRLDADTCRATVLSLASTHVDISEQSLPFVGGWKMRGGRSWEYQWIRCPHDVLTDPVVAKELRDMGRPMPIVKFVLMTHTSQLATLPGGATYEEWSKSGTCAPAALPSPLITTPATIERAMLGQNDDGTALVPAADLDWYYDTVLGIDTAGPETTCFTPAGMAYYTALIQAVYDASKARRARGWNGKLLVHTHVGEGSVIDYVPPPALPWTFADAFAALPPTRSNAMQARSNVTALLESIAAFERAHPDVHDYVVFRLAHATWATPEQAAAMHDERVEADVNLESNVATGAYPVARMPGAAAIDAQLERTAADPASNFELNDVLAVLLPDEADPQSVGAVLGNVSLKYLLEKRVRCVLGTDADGVEHSDIAGEYRLAGALVAYWKQTDPSFAQAAGDAGVRRLFENVRWHLLQMSTPVAQPYE